MILKPAVTTQSLSFMTYQRGAVYSVHCLIIILSIQHLVFLPLYLPPLVFPAGPTLAVSCSMWHTQTMTILFSWSAPKRVHVYVVVSLSVSHWQSYEALTCIIHFWWHICKGFHDHGLCLSIYLIEIIIFFVQYSLLSFIFVMCSCIAIHILV